MLYTVTLNSNIVEYQKFSAVSISKLQSRKVHPAGEDESG